MLNIKLLPKQAEVFRSEQGIDYDIALYQGGFGSGKTFLGALIGLAVCAKNPGCTWLVGADSLTRLSISTCDTYESLLDKASVRYKFNRSDHTIKIPGWDNARIIFKGLDDPQSLRSVNGIGGHLEEASLLSERAFLEFLGRLRQAEPEIPIRVVLTTNPQSTRGWLYEHFVRREGVTVEKIRDKEIKVHRRRVQASTLENPHVSDAFLATLRGSYDEEMYRIMVLGEDGDYSSGLVVKGWSLANIEDIFYNPGLRIYLTCDFNVDPMCWALAHRVNGEYLFFDEIVRENTNIVDTAAEFARKYQAHEAGIIITGDASGNHRGDLAAQANTTRYDVLVKTLSDYGVKNFHLDVNRSNPPIESRIEVWNSLVLNQNGIRRVKVAPRCKQIIKIMENLHYLPGSFQMWQPTPHLLDRDPKSKFLRNDMFDAVSYLTWKYDPKIKPESYRENRPRIRTRSFTA